MKPMREQLPDSPAGRPFPLGARLLALLAAAALLGSLLLTAYLDRTLPDPATPSARQGSGLVILFEDERAPRFASRLLAAGLATQGLGLAILPEPDAALAGDIARLQAESGLASDRLIYAAPSGSVPALVRLLGQSSGLPRPGAVLLLDPEPGDPLQSSDLATLPESLPLAVIASSSPDQARHAADLFLWLTGEDTTLFPGFRGGQPLAPETWLSVDGRRRLALMPLLTPLGSSWSLRLQLAAVQSAADMLATDAPAQLEASARLSATAATLYSRTLMALTALLLLIAAPLLAILARQARESSHPRQLPPAGPVRTADQEPPAGPARTAGQVLSAGPARSVGLKLPAGIALPLYLPAAVLALPAGQLLATLAGDSRLATGYRFYALLGIYGWLWLIAQTIRRLIARPTDTETAGVPETVPGIRPAVLHGRHSVRGARQIVPPALTSAAMALLLLAAAAGWLQTMTGALTLHASYGLLLLLLLPLGLLMLPALLPFSSAFSQPEADMGAFIALLHGLLPALFLFALKLADSPADPLGALLAAVAGTVLLLAVRTVSRSLSAPGVRPLLPALAGLLLLLLFQPFPLY